MHVAHCPASTGTRAFSDGASELDIAVSMKEMPAPFNDYRLDPSRQCLSLRCSHSRARSQALPGNALVSRLRLDPIP